MVGEGERVLVQGVTDFFEAWDGTESEYGIHLAFVSRVSINNVGFEFGLRVEFRARPNLKTERQIISCSYLSIVLMLESF